MERTSSVAELAVAITVQIEGHRFILSTKVPDENENKLLIFKSDTFGIDYKLSQTITLPDKTARNAGAVFDYAGKKYKVSQIFDGGYGKGLVFYQVLQQEDKLSIIESFRKYPLNGYSGMHTFNQYYGYAVVDLCRQIHPFWNKVYKLIHK